MIYLIVAFQAEARSLIDHYQLKPTNEHKWRVYQNREITLALSGSGKIRSAMAATYLYSQFHLNGLQNGLTVNIGLCGSADPKAFQLGDMVVINQVVDHGTQRRYFPDMLLQHNLKEAGLATFDRPVTDKGNSSMPLVDMEASGFFEAAAPYFSPDRILCIKIVSDYLDVERISKNKIQNLFSPVLEEIDRLLQKFNKIHSAQKAILSESDQCLITDLVRHLKLTVTQQHQLKTLAEGYLIRNHKNLSYLKKYFTQDVSSKYEAKQSFNAIKSSLSQP